MTFSKQTTGRRWLPSPTPIPLPQPPLLFSSLFPGTLLFWNLKMWKKSDSLKRNGKVKGKDPRRRKVVISWPWWLWLKAKGRGSTRSLRYGSLRRRGPTMKDLCQVISRPTCPRFQGCLWNPVQTWSVLIALTFVAENGIPNVRAESGQEEGSLKAASVLLPPREIIS